MRIILIGFMCSGKSTVARILADKLSIPVLEMDDLIIKKSGFSSIPEIFTLKGEAFFRELESAVALECSNHSTAVISTGGGIIGNPLNLRALRQGDSKIVYLRTKLETVLKRLELQGQWSTRPLLASKERTTELYNSRQLSYADSADFTVDTDSSSVEQIAEQIIERLIIDRSNSTRSE